MMNATGSFLGYDPGGDGNHGVAVLRVDAGKPSSVEVTTLQTAEDALRFFERQRNGPAIGIDTLTCWSTGPGGWRPADRWLRENYPKVRNSVVTPNGLFGSMGLNGPSVLLTLRNATPCLMATETHPKVLHCHFSNERYDFLGHHDRMNALLARLLHLAITVITEHAWDAAISAYAAYVGYVREWSLDLHDEYRFRPAENERIVWPCGQTHYFWPSA